MTKDEAMRMALDVLCLHSIPRNGYRRNELHLTPKPHIELYQEAIEALRTALAQPKKEWVGLTDDERYLLMNTINPLEYAKAIEAKLKEKNS